MQKLRSQDGQTLVEFALILPILLLIILGVFDFGTAYNYQNDMSQLANEAARYASVGNCTGCSTSNEIPAVVKQNADTGALRDPTTGVTICIVFPTGSSGQVGDAVEAIVEKSYTWLPYLNLASSNLYASATMRLEQPYTAGVSPYTPDSLVNGNCSSYSS